MSKPRLTREQIAERAALELPDGAYVNLGWGIPNLIAAYVPKDITI
jgi:acyl CoA:acetate/3-ketoacid CoA transferase beta subunit